jgi:hypothetical protein
MSKFTSCKITPTHCFSVRNACVESGFLPFPRRICAQKALFVLEIADFLRFSQGLDVELIKRRKSVFYTGNYVAKRIFAAVKITQIFRKRRAGWYKPPGMVLLFLSKLWTAVFPCPLLIENDFVLQFVPRSVPVGTHEKKLCQTKIQHRVDWLTKSSKSSGVLPL